jgi:ADP-ribosylglycohydrolase
VVVPFVNLPMHVFQAEHAAQAQTTHQAAVAGQAAAATERTQDRAAAQESRQIAEMNDADGMKVDTETGGAHSHTLAEEERRKRAEEEAAAQAPDPTGRGRVLDVSI